MKKSLFCLLFSLLFFTQTADSRQYYSCNLGCKRPAQHYSVYYCPCSPRPCCYSYDATCAWYQEFNYPGYRDWPLFNRISGYRGCCY